MPLEGVEAGAENQTNSCFTPASKFFYRFRAGALHQPHEDRLALSPLILGTGVALASNNQGL
jgi:hypothetical protein